MFGTTVVAIGLIVVTLQGDIHSNRVILMDRLGGRQTHQGDKISKLTVKRQTHGASFFCLVNVVERPPY